MILGIDIGGTTTKLIGYNGTEMVRPITVKTNDHIASAAGALGKFVDEEGCSLSDIQRVSITGVGAGRIAEKLLGVPVFQVGEFQAIGRGGTFLSGISKGIVVSMGTGTAIVEVDGESMKHWGGTGVGGGTIFGLSKHILGVTDMEILNRKSVQGNLDLVDLTVGDISSAEAVGLSNKVTASNFGKSSDDASPDDLALAIMNLVFQTIGVLSKGAALATGNTDIIMTGRLARMDVADKIFADLSEWFDLNFIIPELSEYATAVGAALSPCLSI
ncbi:MAG: pantothenate kinase [Spirochaetales bacterium]|nr:pantothenate kinase [Spirochaetales bacterium]